MRPLRRSLVMLPLQSYSTYLDGIAKRVVLALANIVNNQDEFTIFYYNFYGIVKSNNSITVAENEQYLFLFIAGWYFTISNK